MKITENYFESYEGCKKNADSFQKENIETYRKELSFQCDCGESAAIYINDNKSLDTLAIFVHCKACYMQYE